MTARWIAGAIAVTMLSIVGFFVLVALNPPPAPDEANRVSATALRGTQRATRRIADWTLSAEVTPRSGRVTVRLMIVDSRRNPVLHAAQPMAVLRMPEMDMGDQALILLRERPGVWTGSIGIPMAGRWHVQIRAEGEQIVVPFDALDG